MSYYLQFSLQVLSCNLKFNFFTPYAIFYIPWWCLFLWFINKLPLEICKCYWCFATSPYWDTHIFSLLNIMSVQSAYWFTALIHQIDTLARFGAELGIEPWRTLEKTTVSINYLSLTGLKLPPGIFRSNATSHHTQTIDKMMLKLFISASVRLSTAPNRITSNPNEILITTFTEAHDPKLLRCKT